MDTISTLEETHKAIQSLSSGKAPGLDCIPADTKKVVQLLPQLFQLIKQHEMLPQNFKDTSIIHLHKHNGIRHAYDNQSGISLLSIEG